jgi:cytochrome b subunit of formate dehydrogenase
VRKIYLVLIGLTIGAFTLHNGLIWWRKALAARHQRFTLHERLSRSQRIQHVILAVSFIVLALTGFALKYPDSWLALLLGADEAIRRWSHRVAALALILLAFYHVLYVTFTREGRSLVRAFWPGRSDVSEARHNVAYALGHVPRMARPKQFGYAEKIEYWAVVWGTIIMGITGLMIWFPVEVTRFLPRWTVDVATTIHYYEAILACLAIVVWHFYHVIFDPDIYPLNWAFWDGRTPKAHAHEPAPSGSDTKA